MQADRVNGQRLVNTIRRRFGRQELVTELSGSRMAGRTSDRKAEKVCGTGRRRRRHLAFLSSMRQATLSNLGKRPSSSIEHPTASSRSSSSSKKARGSLEEPIDLSEPPEVIDLDAEPPARDMDCGDTATAGPGPGPSTANPLRINDPAFDIKTMLSRCQPKVILKDPDLDLLYFKTMSECVRSV